MKTLKEYITEGLLDRVKNKEVNHEVIVKEFLEANYNCQQFTISNKDGKFVVDGTDILVTNKNITSLTNNFFIWGKVKRNFDCSNCKSLTSLEGAPKEMRGSFYCHGCTSLTSLEGAPEEISDSFNCSHCSSLTSLEGAPKEVKWVFDCSNCKSLTSLEGAPQKVGETFRCRENKFSIEDIKKVVKAKRISI